MRRISALVALAATAVAGCGGGGNGSDAEQVKRAATDYAHAFGEADGAKACALLTPGARAAFVARVASLVGTRDCAEAVSKLQAVGGASITGPFQDATVDSPHVSGNRATVRIVTGGHGETVTLQKVGGDWLLTKVPGS